MKVYKYYLTDLEFPLLTFDPNPVIKMPLYNKVIHVDVQHANIVVWAEVWEDTPEVEEEFAIIATGGEVPANHRHLKTLMLEGGHLLLHVYQKRSGR